MAKKDGKAKKKKRTFLKCIKGVREKTSVWSMTYSIKGRMGETVGISRDTSAKPSNVKVMCSSDEEDRPIGVKRRKVQEKQKETQHEFNATLMWRNF